MAHLFSPITIARTRLANRIVMAPLPSGLATLDGFVQDDLLTYYSQRASGGVGLIITEPLCIHNDTYDQTRAHIGLYADVFIPRLRRLTDIVHEHDTRIIAYLDAPAPMTDITSISVKELRRLSESFILGAWRSLAAGFDGIMLPAADGSVLHKMISPLSNRRFDDYGNTLNGRLRMALEIIESIHQWLGTRLLISFRLIAEEFEVGGITLQDSRFIARRVTASGVHLIDVTADTGTNHAPIARFPGWCVPLAHTIKRSIPDIPVIGSGTLGEPYLADSVIREGSVDLVMLGQSLRMNPLWPQLARSFLVNRDTDLLP